MKQTMACVMALVLSAAPAGAVDFTTELLARDGKPMSECIRMEGAVCAESVTLTLGKLCVAALDTPEQNLTASEIVKRGLLARKIQNGEKSKAVEVSVEEAALLKAQIVKMNNLTTSIKFQALELIDPAGVKKE